MLRARSELCSSNNCLKKWTSCKRSDVFSDPSTSRLRGGPFLGFRRRMSVLHVASATRTTRKKKTLEQTPNRLINEQSPDLISYAHNLVDWYPWGEEAFEKARTEDKLIFLSVGYLSCHWCHVMETESFTNPEIAKILNENFVPIKVDREERPDVDRMYTIFVQGTLGYSGWPLNVFLTPELDPIFGATYIPYPAQEEIPGMKEVLEELLNGWNKDRESAIETGRECRKEIQNALTPEPSPFDQNREDGSTLVDDVMDACADALIQSFDEKYGGFERDSKFPRPSSLKLLMRQFVRRNDNADNETLAYVLKAVLYTLGALHDGGVHDHVGGGFHRFAIDRIWHVPHFEKMLVDNAQIVQAYLSFSQLMPEPTWYETVRSTLDYMMRELRSPEGAFYSGQDSDSFDRERGEKAEGAYYVWQSSEIQEVLSKEEYEIFKDYYNVMDEGNCNLAKTEEEKEVLTNCLVIQERLSDLAKNVNMEPSEVREMLGNCRQKLYEKRNQREKPKLDEKIVCGYNGMAITAFAEASRVLSFEPESSREPCFPSEGTHISRYLEVALEIGEFILEKLWNEEKETLYRFYSNGTSSIPAFAEDYAQVIAGFLDLYTCSGELAWLQWALRFQDKMDELFWDPAYGGYFMNYEENQSSPFRFKFCFDTEEPAASSVAVSNLLRISGIIQQCERYEVKAKETIEAFASYFEKNAISLPELASSTCLVDVHPSLLKIVLIGDLDDDKTQEYLSAIHASYAPSKSLIAIDPSDSNSLEFWSINAPELMENLRDYVQPTTESESSSNRSPKEEMEEKSKTVSKKISLPVVFICEAYECAGPLESPEMLMEYMRFAADEEAEEGEVDEMEDEDEDDSEIELNKEDFQGDEENDDFEDAIDVESTSNE